MDGIVSFIISAIENYINEVLSEKYSEFVHKKKTSDFITKLEESITQYCRDNQSMYLDSKAFSDFWENGKPYQKIFQNRLSVDNAIPFDTLLSAIISEAKDCSEKNKHYWTIDDGRAIKKLCELINHEFRMFISENMDDGQRFIASSISSASSGLHQDIVDGNRNIEEMLKRINASISLKPYEVLPIVEMICDKMWEGQFDDVERILPLSSLKSKDIEISIRILKQLMLVNEYDEHSLSVFLRSMDFCEIRDCVVRHIIPLLVFREKKLGILSDFTSSEEIKIIINSIDDNNFSNIFIDKVSVDSGIEMHSFSFIPELYAKEKWLLNQLFAVYVYRLKTTNISAIIESTIGTTKTTWLSDLVVYDKRIGFIESTYILAADNKNELMVLKNQVLAQSDLYKCLSNDYALIYYRILLRLAILLDQGEDSQLVGLIPVEMLSSSILYPFDLALRINKNDVSFDEVYSYCNNTQEYGLLICYMTSLGRSDKMLELYNTHSEIIQKNVILYALYVDCLIHENRIDEARDILLEYQNTYDSYYEYWNLWYRVFHSDEKTDILIEKCKKGEIKFLNVYSLSKLIERLISLEQFELAEKYNNELCIRTNSTSQTKKYSAFILNGKNKQLDALELLCSIFEEYKTDVSVVNAIISISIRNKRRIDQKYIDAAERINTPFSLVLASMGYASSGNDDEAYLCNMRAMFLSDDYTNPAFSCYLGSNMHSLDDSHSDYQSVEKNTVAIFQEMNTNRLVKYGIHASQDLPGSPVLWQGDHHMYMSDAARLGIYKMKLGGEVNIGGLDYKLVRIESLRSYLLQKCFESIVKTGAGKALTIPVKDGKLDVNAFARLLTEISGDDKDRPDWITQYKNFSDVPLPLFTMHRFYNATYVEFAKSFLCDRSICIREEINNYVPSSKKVILSFLSVLLLEHIGVPTDVLVNNSASITESCLLQIRDDTSHIITRNAQDTVASIGVRDGKPYSVETGDEVKRKLIIEAGELVSYVEKIPSVVSNSDWNDKSFSEIRIIDLLGIVDYDSISLASKDGYSLVVSECFVDNMARNKENNVNTVCITNWLLSTSVEVFDLIVYVKRLVECGCIYAVTEELVNRIVTEYNAADEGRQEKLISSWEELILTFDKADESYRNYALEALRNLFVKLTSGTDDVIWNPIIHNMGMILLRLFNIQIGCRINENGQLEIGWYQD